MRLVQPPIASPDVPTTRRGLWTALALSLVLHGVLVAVLAALTSLGAGGRNDPFTTPPLVATLASAPVRFAVPAAEPPPPSADTPARTPEAADSAPLPVPLKPKPLPATTRAAEGNAIAQALESTDVPDATLAAMLASMHPDALHALPDFVAAPAPIYPAKALPDRLQHERVVIVVVREDGRVAPLDGTLGDSLFDASIRAALTAARARPALVDGQPRTSWSLMRFAYEYVGVRE